MQRWSKVRLAENATAAQLGGVDARANAHSRVAFGFHNRLQAGRMDGLTPDRPGRSGRGPGGRIVADLISDGWKRAAAVVRFLPPPLSPVTVTSPVKYHICMA